jgi:hypothetical protein
MKISKSRVSAIIQRATLALAALAMLLSWRAEAVGHWMPVTTSVGFLPNQPGHMLLLPDGRVMIQAIFSTNWYSLSPDGTGGYTNGVWATLASMHNPRYYYSSDVLTDGRVLIAGGEYGTGGALAEVYDPVADTWTLTPTAGVGFSDSESVILPDGTVLVSPVSWNPYPQFISMIYDPRQNTWTTNTPSFRYQDECSWTKLPDDSIFTVDDNSTRTERYVPSLGYWVTDAGTPVQLWDLSNGEIGASLLLPNGNVFCLGGSGNTAIYTPSGSTNHGTWTTGPVIPNGYVMQDAPSALLPNGKVLFACSTAAAHNPFYFFEYDPSANSYTQVASPTGGLAESNSISDGTSMVQLPDGTVLFNDTRTQLYVYVPDGSPVASGKPTISSIGFDNQGVLQLSGKVFNGISQGAKYGDDAQQDSNYPLLRFTDSGGGVSYGRTFNWSCTSVQTGGLLVTAEANASTAFFGSPGTYSVQVVANGIASSPVSLTTPSWTWVDFNYGGLFQFGTFDFPYPTLPQGVSAVPSGGTIAINASVQPSTGHVTVPYTISTPMNIISVYGSSTIGK